MSTIRPLQSYVVGGTGTYTPNAGGTAASLVGMPPPTQSTGTSNLEVYDEGVLLTPGATTLNFTGTGVTASAVGTAVTVNVPTPTAVINTQDEGVLLSATVTTLNFVGAGVTASGGGATTTVTISGAPTGAAGGDLANTYPNPTLAAIGAGGGPIGDATNVAAITYDTKGRVTAVSAVPITFPAATVTTQEEGVSLSTTVTTLNFVGAGVTASGAGATTTVTVPAAAITTQEEGVTLSSTVNTLNFVGAGVTATGAGTTTTITIPTSGTITTQEEGSTLSSAVTTLNWVGQDVVASGGGATTTITNGGLTTTVTSATPVVLTAASTRFQVFTGSTAQTVTLPVVATAPASNGYHWTFVNASTAALTIRTSGLNTLATVNSGGAGTALIVDIAGGTGTASWRFLFGLQQGMLTIDSAASPAYPTAADTKGVWYGTNTQANAFDSLCVTLGVSADTNASRGTAVGGTAVANGDGGIAVGYGASSTGDTAIAIGRSAVAAATTGIAIGWTANSAGAGNVAVGQSTSAAATATTAVGSAASASTDRCTAIGNVAVASADGATAVGTGASATGIACVVVGRLASCTQQSGTAIGRTTTVDVQNGVALGYLAATNSVANALTLSASGVARSPNDAAHSLALGVNTTSVNPGTLGVTVNGASFVWRQYSSDFASTATAAGTTTLTVTSARQQYFTGTTTQTCVLPVVTTLANGFEFKISNLSTGAITVNTSGGNTVATLAAATAPAATWGFFTCINTAGGTGTASWSYEQGV